MPVSTSATCTKSDNKILTPEVRVALATLTKGFGYAKALTTTAASSSATVVKSVGLHLTGTALTRAPRQAALAATATTVAVVSRAVSKSISVASPPVALITKSAGRKYTATVTALATISTGTATQIKTLTASVVSVPSVVLSTAKALKTGATIPLPPIFSSATPITTLAQVFIPGRVLSATVGTASSMVKLLSFHLSPDVVSSTATVTAIKALSIQLLSTTVTVASTVTKQMVQNARFVVASAVASVQRTTNQIASLVLSATTAVSAALSFLFGEDAPAHPSQSGLTLTSVTKGALTLASRTKQILTRKDI